MSPQVMVVNVINEIMFGFRHKYSASGPLLKFVTDLNEASSQVFLCLPFLRLFQTIAKFCIEYNTLILHYS